MRYAVVVPGSGSSVGFVTRAFGPALAAAGYTLHALPPATGTAAVERTAAALATAAGRLEPALVGGVSLGAHLVARWAAGRADGPAGLLLVLPGWTGAAGEVAAASAYAADRIDHLGTPGALAEAERGTERWVHEELSAAWPAYGDELAATLRATAAATGPTLEELAAIGVPAGVVAFADDPLHPLGVARRWAAAIPRAALRTMRLAEAAADRGVLGTAALAALATAAGPAAPGCAPPARPDPSAAAG